MIALVALAIIGLVVSRLQPAGVTLAGNAVAIDGDTLRLGSDSIRLLGVDAPELDQSCSHPDGSKWPCGREARAFVVGLLRQGSIGCARFGIDRYGRILARCTLNGDDIGAAIARAGWAVSKDWYAADALQARTQQLGIWSGSFDPPASWRHNHDPDRNGLWDRIRSWFQ